jgi:hypothetical protein
MKNEIYRKKLDGNGQPLIEDGDFVMELVNSEIIELYGHVDEFKTAFLSWVDERTTDNIFVGFTFDSKVFSMSLTAQINWSNLLNIPQVMFPLVVMSKTDESYSLSYANVQNFYLSALGHKNNCLQSGNTKKESIKNCLTINDLKLLADQWGFNY